MNTPNENGKPTDHSELLKQQAASCGPGCNCNATGKPSNKRWVIGAIVLVAAGVLVARDIVKSDGASAQIPTPGYAALAATPTPADVPAPTVEMSVGTTIGAFSELNEVAIKTDAVFIFLPGKDGTSSNSPASTMNKAARTIEAQGKKIGLFTLKAGSSDYEQIAAQMPVPGVLAVVKGRGMSGISGDITETKLVQGYLAASSAAGCGSSAGAGCCPK